MTYELTMARIIWSWQCCRLLVGNIANGIASKTFFLFLTELGNFKQNIFRGNAIGNVAKRKSAALLMLRADDSGHCRWVQLFNLLKICLLYIIKVGLWLLPKKTWTKANPKCNLLVLVQLLLKDKLSLFSMSMHPILGTILWVFFQKFVGLKIICSEYNLGVSSHSRLTWSVHIVKRKSVQALIQSLVQWLGF